MMELFCRRFGVGICRRCGRGGEIGLLTVILRCYAGLAFELSALNLDQWCCCFLDRPTQREDSTFSELDISVSKNIT